MAKTADVLQSIWSDPWFVALSSDGKLLYLWAITTDHGNLAGLFTVAQTMIQFETGLSEARFEKALEALEGKLDYRAESGAIWVVARVKHVRSRTTQIAKSIAKAVRLCPEPELQEAFVTRYGRSTWLSGPLSDLALDNESIEPHPSLIGTSHEVPSQSQSQSQSTTNPRDEKKKLLAAEWADWLAHFHKTTGRSKMIGSAEAKRSFAARRHEGRSLDDLKCATVGCHSEPNLRERGFNRPETILREGNIGRYIELGTAGGSSDSSTQGLDDLVGRSA